MLHERIAPMGAMTSDHGPAVGELDSPPFLRRFGPRRVVEVLVLVVAHRSAKKAGTQPLPCCDGGDAELVGDLGDGQEAGFAQPVVARA